MIVTAFGLPTFRSKHTAFVGREDRAKEDYDLALRNGYKGKYSLAEFISRYTNPKVPKTYDFENDHWVNHETVSVAVERLSTSTSIDDAMDKLTGAGPKSSFKLFYEMLLREKLATDKEVRDALQGLLDAITTDRSIDYIRHDLKAKFKQKALEAMFTGPDGEPLTPEQSHAAMLRITEGLNSSDKGNMTEDWIDRFRGLDPENPKAGEVAKHVEVRMTVYPRLGLRTDRVLDRVEGDSVNEVKSTASSITERDIEQHGDIMKLVGAEGGSELEVNGTMVIVRKAKLTFTNPAGALANLDWIIRQLTAYANMSVEVFNREGRGNVFNDVTMGKNGETLRKFLGQ